MVAVASRVEAQITGSVSGQVAVGNHIIQNNVDHGGIVYMAAPGETPTPRRRPSPVILRGRRAPDIVGRERDVEAALAGLRAASPVEFVGPSGIGKTTVLKHLAHTVPTDLAVDGVVYHQALGEAVDDSLQFLYEAFYETSVPFKPTDAQLRHGLRDIGALVVLDDVAVDRNGAAQILDTLPAANIVLAGSRRSLLGGDYVSRPLRGLDRAASVALLLRTLGRDEGEDERAAAAAIADAVGGQPLQLLQVAALVSDLGYELAELADDLRQGSAPDALGRLLLDSLDDDQRQILEVLVTLAGATLPADQLAELTGVAEAGPILESLMRLGLVQAHSPRYSTTGTLEPTDLGAASGQVEAAARAHLIRWVERSQADPEAVLRELQAILAVLRTAARDHAWADVLRLGRAVEGALVLCRRWGAWREVLDLELTAARALGDRAAESWALHQIGSRALCLDDRGAALAALTEALRIRERLGDDDGAAATRHNLGLLLSDGYDRGSGAQWSAPAIGWSMRLILPFLVVPLLVIGGVLWWPDSTKPPSGSGLTARPASLDFGNQATGTSSPPRAISLSNDGRSTMTLPKVSIIGPEAVAFRLDRDTCSGATLARQASCMVSVVFTPGAVGQQQAALNVAGQGFSAAPVGLRGAGATSTTPPVVAGRLRLEPAAIDFGRVALSTGVTRTVAVRNDGGTPLQLGPAVITGADQPDFSVRANRCPPSLAPGARCSLDLTFRPLASAARLASLGLSTLNTDEARGATLTGIGTSQPVVPPPSIPDPPVTIDLRLPTSRTVTYGETINLTASATVSGGPGAPAAAPTLSLALLAVPVPAAALTPKFTATGLPLGVRLVDHHDGTAALEGTILSAPGVQEIRVGVGSGSATKEKTFTLTIVAAEVAIRWSLPILEVTPGSTVTATALLSQVTGTNGDLTRAKVAFDVLPCTMFGRGPVPVDAAGKAVLTVDKLPLGTQTVRARLADTTYFRLASTQSLSIVAVPDALTSLVYLYPDPLTSLLGPLPCAFVPPTPVSY